MEIILKWKNSFFYLFLKKAEKSLKYYKGRKGNTEEESVAFLDEFEKLKSIATEQKVEEKIGFKDICKLQKIRKFQKSK